MDVIDYYDEMKYSLIKAQEKKKLKFEENYNMTIESPFLDDALKKKVDVNLLEFYKEISDGFRIKWFSDEEKGIGGNIHFMEMKHVLADQKGNLYDDQDIQMNDLIQYYKPFDLISETFSCGFLITPDFVSTSIYCHNSPDPETYDLDLDFAGYMEMAYEAKIFQYWPKVLLDIKANYESAETKAFKEHMPKIFEDFDWDSFVQKYESLRLSKKE